MQPCEVTRDESADILDAAGRPSARSLGAEAIRFSKQPGLGTRGLIVEIVGDTMGGGQVRVFTFWGSERASWRLEHLRRFALPAASYRQLAGAVDAAIANRALPPTDVNEQIICMDGPGYLTERVSNGTVRSLTGFCPANEHDPHANEVIATLIRDMLCRHHDPASDRAYWGRRRCYSLPFTMRGA